MTVWLFIQRGRVRKRRDILADVFRIGEVPLELDPLGFTIRAAQGADEGGIILFGQRRFLYSIGRTCRLVGIGQRGEIDVCICRDDVAHVRVRRLE